MRKREALIYTDKNLKESLQNIEFSFQAWRQIGASRLQKLDGELKQLSTQLVGSGR